MHAAGQLCSLQDLSLCTIIDADKGLGGTFYDYKFGEGTCWLGLKQSSFESEICKGFTHLVQYIRLRLRRCKKRVEKKKVKPIIYDNAHIIVINPYEKYQIATVSKVIN